VNLKLLIRDRTSHSRAAWGQGQRRRQVLRKFATDNDQRYEHYIMYKITQPAYLLDFEGKPTIESQPLLGYTTDFVLTTKLDFRKIEEFSV
jgi:hypothetical protein